MPLYLCLCASILGLVVSWPQLGWTTGPAAGLQSSWSDYVQPPSNYLPDAILHSCVCTQTKVMWRNSQLWFLDFSFHISIWDPAVVWRQQVSLVLAAARSFLWSAPGLRIRASKVFILELQKSSYSGLRTLHIPASEVFIFGHQVHILASKVSTLQPWRRYSPFSFVLHEIFRALVGHFLVSIDWYFRYYLVLSN